MKRKDYRTYAPDKHGPEAEARKREAAEFIRGLQAKHGVSDERLYPPWSKGATKR